MIFYPISQKFIGDKEIRMIQNKLELNCLEVYNRIRASSPKYYPAFIIIKGIKYLLFKAKMKDYKSRYTNKKIIVKKDRLLINYNDKHLLIKDFKRLKNKYLLVYTK